MKLEDLNQLFKCLSDPVRLRILNLLFHKDDICVCDIVSALALPQSVVSRHLAYLRKHGLVSAERRGNWQYYSQCMADEKLLDEKQVLAQQVRLLLENEASCQQDLQGLSEQACC